MNKIITFHSYRRGAGKTHISANIACQLALDGYQVGIMDTSFLSPGIHILFQLDETHIKHYLNDFIFGKCSITDTVFDVSKSLKKPGTSKENFGNLYVAPASPEPIDILKVLRYGSDLNMIGTAQQEMIDAFKLDILIIDTYSGLNEIALHSTALSSSLALIMRPDKQDYDGTGIILDIAKKLSVPSISLLMNEVPFDYSLYEIENELQDAYQCKIGAVIPHIEDMQAMASSGIFILQYPQHPAVSIFSKTANTLINGNKVPAPPLK